MTDQIDREDAQYEREYRASQGERSDYTPFAHRDTGTGRTADADRGFERFLRTGENRATSGFSTLTDAEGGYLVPSITANQVLKASSETNVMRRICRIITSAGDISFPTGAALAATWVDEEGAYVVPQHNVFGSVDFKAYKSGLILPICEELLQDSAVNVEQYIAQAFGEAIGVLEEAAFVSGDGTKKPTGVLTSATAGVTTALANAIAADEIVDLFHSVSPAYREQRLVADDRYHLGCRSQIEGRERSVLWWALGRWSVGATDRARRCSSAATLTPSRPARL